MEDIIQYCDNMFQHSQLSQLSSSTLSWKLEAIVALSQCTKSLSFSAWNDNQLLKTLEARLLDKPNLHTVSAN